MARLSYLRLKACGNGASRTMQRSGHPRPALGIRLIGVFLMLSTGILLASAATLLMPGTWLDGIWAVKPQAYAAMLPYRFSVGAGFGAFALVMAAAAWGWWHRRRWAWRLVLVIFALNAASDATRLFRGEVMEGAFGLVMVGLLFLYVRSARVRKCFLGDPEPMQGAT